MFGFKIYSEKDWEKNLERAIDSVKEIGKLTLQLEQEKLRAKKLNETLCAENQKLKREKENIENDFKTLTEDSFYNQRLIELKKASDDLIIAENKMLHKILRSVPALNQNINEKATRQLTPYEYMQNLALQQAQYSQMRKIFLEDIHTGGIF